MGAEPVTRKNFVQKVLFLLGVVTWGSVAWAQSRRIIIEEVLVEGKVQKPEITIFITRQNLNTEYNLELRESFIPKIQESVNKKPF